MQAKRFIWIFAFCTTIGYTQREHVENISALEDFPVITLKVTDREPELRAKNAFSITENRVGITIDSLRHERAGNTNDRQNLLILVENLHHTNRLNFYKSVLTQTLTQNDLENYNINIAVFDRVRNQGTTPIAYLLPNYTNDKTTLLQAVKNIKPKSDIFGKNQSSDLYHAVYQGLSDIDGQFPGNSHIWLLSTGFNNKWSSHTSSESVKAFAKEKDITVYSLQYRLQGYEHHKLTDIAHANYGSEKVTPNVQEGVAFLSGTLNEILYNKGWVYTLFYTSQISGTETSLHNASLKIGNRLYPFTFQSPVKSSHVRYKDYTYIVAGIVAVILIFLIVILARLAKNKKKREFLEQEIYQEKNQISSIQNIVNRQKTELNALHEKEKNEMLRKELEEAEQQQLLQMKLLGVLPRLEYSENGRKNVFAIKKPVTTVGRNPDNDLVISSQTVSRNHAVIAFEENAYVIKNLSKTSPVKVNGNETGSTVLSHGCLITLGNINITFIQ